MAEGKEPLVDSLWIVYQFRLLPTIPLRAAADGMVRPQTTNSLTCPSITGPGSMLGLWIHSLGIGARNL